jgi:hypothetical protein
MITLPSSAPTDIFASTGSIFNDLWGLIAIAVGIPLAFFVIDIIIGVIFPKHTQQYTDEELRDRASGIK